MNLKVISSKKAAVPEQVRWRAAEPGEARGAVNPGVAGECRDSSSPFARRPRRFLTRLHRGTDIPTWSNHVLAKTEAVSP